ncbi:MAG TPA: hypothetical protein VK484_13170 [Ferruginibacter sp.]|nr:hypothetical protein [Ferruginibacter sp.]
MKFTLIILFSFFLLSAFSQKRKTYLPVWTIHQKNINIYGLSMGLWNFTEDRNTVSNGIRIALIGEGILAPFAPSGPSMMEDSFFQKINKESFSEDQWN